MTRLFLFIFLITHLPLSSQKEDFVWIMCAASNNSVNSLGYQNGNTVLDFNYDPVQIYYDSLVTLDMTGTNASICNKDGQLIMYTNGMHVHNGHHEDILGLDTIGYGEYWERFNNKNWYPDGSNWLSGFPGQQWALILPRPGNKDHYLLFSVYRDFVETKVFSSELELRTTEVLIDENNPRGKVLIKEQVVKQDTFNTSLNAVRHANGRDWWLITQRQNNEAYFVYLINPEGISLVHEFNNASKFNSVISLGRSYFSPDGSKYVVVETQGDTLEQKWISIYDFDRCTGSLNRDEFKIIYNNQLFTGSLAFSNDSKYLYVTEGEHMYQYDLSEDEVLATEQIIATWDSSYLQYTEFTSKNYLRFGYMVNGPDGRIYNTPPGNVRSLHTIEYPEEEGEAATVIQNKITLPTKNFNTIPNLVHYRLGPIDGSACDTLGIDNMPIAKFRYEVDTLNPLNIRFTDLSYYEPDEWMWDFGDGSNYNGKKPYWHEFPQEGTYDVCLNVKNENGQDISCRKVQIGDISDTNNIGNNPMINLYPNPVETNLLVTISDYIPIEGKIELYNLLGQKLFDQRLYYGFNNLDLSNLLSGVYVYKVLDKQSLLESGSVIKM